MQRERQKHKCKHGTKFLCPKQHLCVGEECLACVKPSCVDAEDKSVAAKLIVEQNQSEKKEGEDM